MYVYFPGGLLNSLSTDRLQSFIFLLKTSLILHELSRIINQVPTTYTFHTGCEFFQKAGGFISGPLKSFFFLNLSQSLFPQVLTNHTKCVYLALVFLSGPLMAGCELQTHGLTSHFLSSLSPTLIFQLIYSFNLT